MKNDDVALIRRVLAGDEAAFAELVNKYQKSVHTLAWRKIGDFHIAEDITQDTFLKVYQRLHTLKDPNQFFGWLYVITANLCATWLRKKRIQTQPLEDTEITMIQEDAYSQHVTEERSKTASESQREVVKQLLAKLKESERTVMTLHYLGEMTVAEISRFLGVSVNTIKTRLRRARNRLQKEEPMIREALEHFQITPNLTENIMREVSRLKPVAPSGGKPLMPWAIAASTVTVIFLMLGIGNRYMSRFQKSYNFDATAEMTVEIIEAPVVLNLEAKPDIRTQLGNSTALSKNEGIRQQPNNPPVRFTAAQVIETEDSVPSQQWIQAEPARGTSAHTIFATPEGELYVINGAGSIYKLSVGGKIWEHILDMTSLNTAFGGQSPIAKWNDTLYLVPSNEFFISTNDGETWDLVYSWPIEYGYPIGLVLTDQSFYLAFDNGIFRSEDGGKTWKIIADETMGYISSLMAIQNTLFAGTDTGLYRFDANDWERLKFPVPDIKEIISIAGTKDRLYVVVELDRNMRDPRQVSRGQQRTWWMFRSMNLGDSWEDITPTNAWPVKGFPPHIKLIADGETLLAMEKGMVRSLDGGNTWMDPQEPGISPSLVNISPAVVASGGTIYVGENSGVYRSTDRGRSWNLVSIGRDSRVDDLVTFREINKGRNTPAILYTRIGEEIAKTIDGGHSWKGVQMEVPMAAAHRDEPPRISKIVASDGVIYAKGRASAEETLLYRISVDDDTLMPIQGMPIFNSRALSTLSFEWQDMPDEELGLHAKSFIEQLQKDSSGATQFFKQVVQDRRLWPGIFIEGGLRGAFAVSDDTFYMEYNFKLFRWKPGESEWFDTGIEETAELSERTLMEGFKLAVSGNTVYVGKRDGRLVTSFDMGNNWLNLTPALPFPVKAFKDIMFADSTVYVATDAGVTASSDGKQWRAITDAAGTPPIIKRLAVDATNVYGVSKTGVYRLESGAWEQLVSEIPDGVTSLAVDGNTLYVGTESSGMLHFNLDK